jgi:phosphoribosylcarboxyaminoimidazole (NCAIR) mutase
MENPLVGVIMGSRSDWETMHHTIDTLTALAYRTSHVLCRHIEHLISFSSTRDLRKRGESKSSSQAQAVLRIFPE